MWRNRRNSESTTSGKARKEGGKGRKMIHSLRRIGVKKGKRGRKEEGTLGGDQKGNQGVIPQSLMVMGEENLGLHVGGGKEEI